MPSAILQTVVKVPFAAQMDDLECFGKFGEVRAHRLVDGYRALAAAHDHEDRFVGAEAAQGQPFLAIAGKQFAADRRAGQHSFVGGQHFHCLREIAADFPGRPKAQLVGQSGRHIGLVDHARNVQGPCRAHHRHADEAAFGEDDIGPVFLQEFAGFSEAVDHSERIREVLQVKISPQLTGRDPHIGKSVIGDQVFLNSVLGSDVGHLIAGFLQVGQERYVG